MDIVTGLETLNIEGMMGGHDHVIETVISKLFVRGDRVYKAYKHRKADFADLTDQAVRRRHIVEDFFWNNKMSPDIYLELRHMAFDGKQFVQVEPDAAEDWYLLMRKVDTKHSLINILETGIPKRIDLILYVETLTKRLEQLTLERTSELEEFVERGTAHIQSEIMGVFAWAQTASPQLDREDTKRTEQVLRRSLSEHSYWRGPVSSLSVVVDNNPDNILFLADGVSFIDTMPPKAEWRVHDRYFALCRTSADISALAGGEQAEVLHETYALKYGLPSDIVRATYEIAAALIQVPYRKMVGRADLADQYATFVRLRTAELEQLLG